MNDQSKEYPEFPVPPDFVFKYRDRSRTVPEKQVLEQEQTMFVGAGIKYPALWDKSHDELKYLGIEREGDDLLYQGVKLFKPTEEEKKIGSQLLMYEKVPYPSKGHPFPPAFYAINGAKRIALNSMKLFAGKDMLGALVGFALTPKKYKISAISRTMVLYTDTMRQFMQPFIVSDEFCTPFTRELRKFINNFFVKFGVPYFGVDGFSESFVMDFEYDNAYRFRVQDAFSVTTKERMLANPAKELALVFRTMEERDRYDEGAVSNIDQQFHQEVMVKKFKAFERILRLALMSPSVKRAFLHAIRESDFKNFQFDEADSYHVLLWPDYQFLGKSQAERWKMFCEIHKDGLPPRLVWRKTEKLK